MVACRQELPWTLESSAMGREAPVPVFLRVRKLILGEVEVAVQDLKLLILLTRMRLNVVINKVA